MEKRYPRTILATACVSWTGDYEFDETTFRRGVKLLLDNGIRSIYIFGTAGEGYAVSRGQFLEITAAFLDEMKKVPGAMPMVGVISLSMSEVIERIGLAMSLGANDFQISFPSWGAVSNNEAGVFLKTVCSRFPSARFMHYNNGLRSRTKLSVGDYKQLAEEIPNLAAVKLPGLDIRNLYKLHSQALPIEFYLCEFDYGFASLGASVGYLVNLSSLNFKRAREYFDAGTRRDTDAIIAIHRDFETVVDTLLEYLPADRIDSAYDKLFVKYFLPDFSERLLPPYEGIEKEQFERFAEEIRKRLPGW